jgi:hypothetical protein
MRSRGRANVRLVRGIDNDPQGKRHQRSQA